VFGFDPGDRQGDSAALLGAKGPEKSLGPEHPATVDGSPVPGASTAARFSGSFEAMANMVTKACQQTEKENVCDGDQARKTQRTRSYLPNAISNAF
jgi:hypothetical protein